MPRSVRLTGVRTALGARHGCIKYETICPFPVSTKKKAKHDT